MSTSRKEYFLLIGGLVLVGVVGVIMYFIERGPDRSRDLKEVSALVTDFAAKEKNVSLQGDQESLQKQIEKEYSPFVSPGLLEQWIQDPMHAPGRLTSSPWPDKIEIDTIFPQGAGYIVSGRVIMASSTGESGQMQVVLMVVPEANGWKIAAYQETGATAEAQ